MIVEARATDDLVVDRRAHQRLFDHLALAIGSVEDRHVPEGHALAGLQPEDLTRHPRCFVELILGSVANDLRPLTVGGEESLLRSSRVVRDDRVRRIQDVLGRSEVLLEHDRGGVGERALEIQDVSNVGGPKSIDRLIRVPDGAHIAVDRTEELDELVLRRVGVLELVDQEMAEPLLVASKHLRRASEQLDGLHQEIIEVHGIRVTKSTLILGIDLGHLAPIGVEAAEHVVGICLRREELSLGLRDDRGDGASRQFLRVDIEIAHHKLDEAARIGGVVDREAGFEPQPSGRCPQHPKACGVEGGDPHALGRRSHELGDSLTHLTRRLVGEGDRQDLERSGVAGRQQVSDPTREHPRLPRSCTSDDQEWSASVLDGTALGLREPFDEGIDGGSRSRRSDRLLGFAEEPASIVLTDQVGIRRGHDAPSSQAVSSSGCVTTSRESTDGPVGEIVTPTRWCRVACSSHQAPLG